MILGVDPGLRKLAWFRDSHLYGEVVLMRGQPRHSEVRSLFSRLYQEILLGEITHVFCEEPVVAGARNLRTTIGIAETVGGVLALPCEVTLVPVSSWKKEVLGNGNSNKQEVARWFQRTYPGIKASQDVCDAAAICEYGRKVVDRGQRMARGGSLSGGSEVP